MPRSLLALLLLALPCRADQALSLRALCIRADTVVLARPLDAVLPTRFEVREPLRGKAKAGEVVDSGLAAGAVRAFDAPDYENGGKPRPRRSEAALLFLDKGKLVGLRLCTEDGRVMGLDASGKAALRPSRWAGIVQRVRQDVATVDHLRACRAMPSPARRTAALAAWVERNRAALGTLPGGDQDDEAPAGWEELSLGVFDWMTETGDLDSAWTAVRLYAGLHGGELFRPRVPAFASDEGQAFLLARARDASSLAGDRARALALLGEKSADAVAGLLSDSEEAVRLAAALALGRVGKGGERVLEAAVAAYKEAKPGPLREELGWLVSGLAPGPRWKELTGNPPGVGAALREIERTGPDIAFWLHLRTGGRQVHEPPVLVLQTLNALGIAMETKRVPLEIVFLARPWKEGWDGVAPLAAKLSLAAYPAGARVKWSVEGFVGQGAGRTPWRSEPQIVKIPNPAPILPVRAGATR